MELENEKALQVSDVYAKYGIASIDDVKSICESKNINVQELLAKVKDDVNQTAIDAFSLGCAIAIKKDTKLASYVAYDIGEALEIYCSPDSPAVEQKVGQHIGTMVSASLKNESEEQSNAVDLGSLLNYTEMSTEQIAKATLILSVKLEEVMTEE